MVEKKSTTKTAATKKTATKKAPVAKKTTAAKKDVLYLNAENAGFRAGDVYQALAAAEKPQTVLKEPRFSFQENAAALSVSSLSFSCSLSLF